MTEAATPPPPLPTREQLQDVHSFVDGRAYHALGPTIRISGHPSRLDDTDRAGVQQAAGAIFAVSRHLYQALWHELGDPEPAQAAHTAWAAFRALTSPWHDHPDLPHHLRPLLTPYPTAAHPA
ncbi:hypothetical protein [Kitasatospora sp. NPDC091207]|uniref:hypothetical protein n=1 Tax=Kitasatospora sp. NPDC091207 TaxID=3364083 RepID=UPI00381809B7